MTITSVIYNVVFFLFFSKYNKRWQWTTRQQRKKTNAQSFRRNTNTKCLESFVLSRTFFYSQILIYCTSIDCVNNRVCYSKFYLMIKRKISCGDYQRDIKWEQRIFAVAICSELVFVLRWKEIADTFDPIFFYFFSAVQFGVYWQNWLCNTLHTNTCIVYSTWNYIKRVRSSSWGSGAKQQLLLLLELTTNTYILTHTHTHYTSLDTRNKNNKKYHIFCAVHGSTPHTMRASASCAWCFSFIVQYIYL